MDKNMLKNCEDEDECMEHLILNNESTISYTNMKLCIVSVCSLNSWSYIMISIEKYLNILKMKMSVWSTWFSVMSQL